MKSMGEVSIKLEHLVKQHGDTLAVDDLSLEIHRGEFFSILGPSGSGKTTTLRLIAGLDQPDGGSLSIEGQLMQDLPPNQRPVNMVFQNYALFPHLTVWKNVSFGLEMKGLSRREIIPKVEQVLDMVQLGEKQNRVPAQLSGGEQQRVALARALVNRPAVLLLDEPLGALDQQLRQEMQGELKLIQERVGITFVFVTHHQEEALIMSDRVAVMNGGRVIQVGTPQELYETPGSTFVARFVGHSNCLDGEVASMDGTTCTFRSDGVSPIQAPCPGHSLEAGRGTFIIRPERLYLTRNAPPNGFENHLPVRIQKTRYIGDEMQYQFDLAPNVRWMARLPISSRHHERFHPGEQVFVSWKAHEGLILTS